MRKAALLVVPLLVSAPAFGQTTPTPAASQPASSTSPAAVPAPGASLTLPPALQIDDPMLVPVPPPKRVLTSWQEAVSMLRARSTDLRIALDQVLQAEAATRVALAQYLPSIIGNG